MSSRWPQADFLRATARPRRPLLAWLWATSSVALLIASGAEAIVTQRGNDARTQQLTRAGQRVAKAGASASAVSVPSATSNSNSNSNSISPATATVDTVRAAQRVRAQFDHPWASILASLEAETPAGLQWLRFDHDSAGPELRFEGLAPQRGDVLELVDRLAARVGWSEVALGRLAAPDSRDGRWRFEIRAVVDAARIAAGAAAPPAAH